MPQQPNSSLVRLNPATITDLLASITQAGLAAPSPRDVTSRDCPQIGCAAKTETDTVSIAVFPTPGRAQLYAGSTHGVIQLEDVVLSFAASVPASRRDSYAQAAKRAIE